jgi:taurine--2-oxoglutarate transaminase
MGQKLTRGLDDLASSHRCVGERRGTGLLQILELVKDRGSREPLSPFNRALSEPMVKVASSLKDSGISTFVRWNWIFSAPPLVVSDEQLQEGLEAIDRALTVADDFV